VFGNLYKISRRINEDERCVLYPKDLDHFERLSRHHIGFRAKIARNNERRAPRNPLASFAATAAKLTCELNTIH